MFLRIHRDILFKEIPKITLFIYFSFDENAVKGSYSKEAFSLHAWTDPYGFKEFEIPRIVRKLSYEDGRFVSL